MLKLCLFFPDDFPDPTLAGKTWSFEPPDGKSAEFKVGRHPDNDLQILVRRVSRHHCALAYSAITGGWSIQDLDSMYGTQLNGRGLVPGDWEPLSIGSRFSLGMPDLTIAVVEDEGDTYSGDEPIEGPEREEVSMAIWQPKTYADSLYLALSWVVGAQTVAGKVYRLLVGLALSVALLIIFLAIR